MNLILIFIAGALINNVVLNQFLGICSFLGVSKQIKPSFSLGMAVVFVIGMASAVANLLYAFVLKPFDLDYLKTIVFILVIAALVQVVEMFLKKTSPGLYKALGIYLPLITTNCAVLGVAVLNVTENYNLGYAIMNGVFGALGFTLAIVCMAGVTERLETSKIPAPLRGFPITLISASLMAVAFMGFGGLA